MATLAAVDLNLAMCVCRDSSLVYTITIASSKGVVYSAELEPGEANKSGLFVYSMATQMNEQNMLCFDAET